MITVQDFTNAIGFKITGGSTYGWDCFAPDARWLDAEEQDKYSASIVFGGPDFTVFVAEVHDYANKRSYRLINPDYRDAYEKASKLREIDPDLAWDENKFIDLESDKDFVEKCTAIANGTEYDTRISIPIEIPDHDLFTYMKMAHERDVTFNSFVESALREAIEEHKRDPEGMKARAQAWKDNVTIKEQK